MLTGTGPVPCTPSEQTFEPEKQATLVSAACSEIALLLSSSTGLLVSPLHSRGIAEPDAKAWFERSIHEDRP